MLIKNESIAEASKKGIIIGDLGGDTVDFVGIKHGKPVASIEGEIFGFNPFLDEIIRKVSKNELYTFDSRAELEEKLIQGPSEWYVEPFAGVRKDISRYIIPQLRLLAIRFLETFDRIRSSSQEIKGATMYIAVGGAASIAQKQIEETAISWKKRGRPIELFFPEDMYKLNVLGLMILAKMNMIKKQQGSHEYVATARG
ncbi:hypothetical protein GCM10010978_07370 [Compostibacillus humi]|uniref:Actin-like protein N-terminal domain-containing protein n=1 Tax=Compostibacillus humi TaxID=1245525 RepID=A0A8J2ZQE7_9BACI|nr:hypothetical protein [Compostibacillus humi]GGH71437.1 hypothetical protein GCM10010978_07370 [Compostibacillus humi]